jgi:glycosyltransferase involved in cell wall biosynthesis
MKVSAFTMVRNADLLYFPIKASIESILPLVDEYIIALGEGDMSDRTKAIIESIESSKIKIYPRVWSESSFKESRIFAEETNFALSKCTGDWCFYLQADEVVHEKDYNLINRAIEKNGLRPEIDGLLFKYVHFWGDYDHYLPFHGWYKNEIRLFKSRRNVYSTKDAQSFRKDNNQKLTVAEIDAQIYHYGWVRPPSIMQSKKKEHEGFHHGKSTAEDMFLNLGNAFDYGPLGNIPSFEGSHPIVMQEWIKKIDWKEELNFGKRGKPNRPLHKHEKWKYRFLTHLENHLAGGKSIFGYSNWKKVK